MTRTGWLALFVAIVFLCIMGLYFTILPPGATTEVLKAKLERTQQEVISLQQKNNLKQQKIKALSNQLSAVRTKYEAERRDSLEDVEKKYSDIDPDGIINALNAITERARIRRMEALQEGGNPK
jgi:hypothetical protein